ncbi:hypothetical protein HYV72_01685 [Candidatus Uhrbacteria bacterium]|nr:hypothetical protein [Candidatus Uhrbacteria bacterium]
MSSNNSESSKSAAPSSWKRLGKRAAGAVAGLAFGAASASAHEGETHGRMSRFEKQAVSPDVKHVMESFGMKEGDAKEYRETLDELFRAPSPSVAAKAKFLLSIADHPPTWTSVLAHEVEKRTELGASVDLGESGIWQHLADGSVMVVDGGEATMIIKGRIMATGMESSEAPAETTVVSDADEHAAVVEPALEPPNEVPPIRDPWKEEAMEKMGEHAAHVLEARADKKQATKALLDWRETFGGDAAFNVALRDQLTSWRDMMGVTELQAEHGAYVLGLDGALYVHAPGKKPVRVVAPK